MILATLHHHLCPSRTWFSCDRGKQYGDCWRRLQGFLVSSNDKGVPQFAGQIVYVIGQFARIYKASDGSPRRAMDWKISFELVR